MDEDKLYLLLNVIFRNGSVKNLSQKGLSLSDIVGQTEQSIQNELITTSKEKILLTDKGIRLLKQFEAKHKKTNKEAWIERDLENKIPRFDMNSVFLPKQNELTF